MRVRSVQLGGSLAGKLSSKLSSILSSAVAAASGSGWRLRRASADPRRCCGMDRGIMSPADSWRIADTAEARGRRRARAHDTPPARGGTLLANAIRAASIASTDLAHLPFEVNALSGRLTSPLGTRAQDMAALESGGTRSAIRGAPLAARPTSASRPRLPPRGRAQRHRPHDGCFEARPSPAMSARRTPAH